jgi:hypothetical protein
MFRDEQGRSIQGRQALFVLIVDIDDGLARDGERIGDVGLWLRSRWVGYPEILGE